MATGARPQDAAQNVNDLERLLSVVAGGALAAYALKRRGAGGLAAGVLGGFLVQRGVTGHCYAYGALGVDSMEHGVPNVVQRHGPAAVLDAHTAQRVVQSVTIDGRSPDELYAFWRDFENLPRIMTHVERVDVIDETRSRWTVSAPAGRTVEWEAEVYNEIPGQLIAWRTLHDADVPNAGSVRFRAAPNGGTEVIVELEYAPPGGTVGRVVAKLFGDDPDRQVREDLQRVKKMLESRSLADGAEHHADRKVARPTSAEASSTSISAS